MSENYPNTMHCMSCGLSCQIFPQQSVRFQYCGNSNFILWPERNIFLQRGLIEEYIHFSKFVLFNGFLFVDFSVTNVRYFLEQDWVDRLSETGMKIIIISDRILMPLANYWLKKWGGIQGIIYADESITNIRYRFERIFSGRTANLMRGKTLTDTEFSLFALLLSGGDIKKIHKLKQLNINKVYLNKNRLEQKLGRNINKIFSMISTTQVSNNV